MAGRLKFQLVDGLVSGWIAARQQEACENSRRDFQMHGDRPFLGFVLGCRSKRYNAPGNHHFTEIGASFNA